MKHIIYTLDQLTRLDEDQFVAELFEHVEDKPVAEKQEEDQLKIDSWKDTLRFLKEQIGGLSKENKDLEICFEYKLPDSSWVDAILFTSSKMDIIEFKGGLSSDKGTLNSHRAQLSGYFHRIFHCNRAVWKKVKSDPSFSVTRHLIYTKEEMREKVETDGTVLVGDDFRSLFKNVSAAMPHSEALKLLDFYQEFDQTLAGAIGEILHERLVNKMYVQNENVAACESIINETEKRYGKNTLNLIFIEGAPGTGKTGTAFSLLANYMQKSAKEGQRPIRAKYVTGNKFLCDYYREVVDHEKSGGTETLAIEMVGNLYNVKQFYECHSEKRAKSEGTAIDCDLLIVDEAQRLWNPIGLANKDRNSQNIKQFLVNKRVSEPLLLLRGLLKESMTHAMTAVFLLGKGQEIYNGEEDGERYLTEALSKTYKWHKEMKRSVVINVYVPTEAMEKRYRQYADRCVVDQRLLLKNNKRNDFNNSVLDFTTRMIDVEYDSSIDARDKRNPDEKAISGRDVKNALFVFNDEKEALEAIKEVKGNYSAGILGCSFDSEWNPRKGRSYLDVAGTKLRVIEKGETFDFFSLTSPNKFDVYASQFSSQGLELDYALVIWKDSLKWRNGHWEVPGRRLKHISGIDNYCRFAYNVLKPDESEISFCETNRELFIKNCYRVLLTRARIATFLAVEDRETYEHINSLINELNN